MTIADAFNEITIAQGGTPNYSGTIAAAIDALNDALAGSDQPADPTIEGAVRLLGQHIGPSITVESLSVTENGTYTAPEGKAYSSVTVEVEAMAYDMVIKTDNSQLRYVTSANVIDGSYDNVAAKVADGEPFNIMVYGANEQDGDKYQTQFCILGAYWDSYVEEGEDPIIDIALSDSRIGAQTEYVSNTSGGSNNYKVKIVTLLDASDLIVHLIVNSDDTVSVS